MYYIKMIPRTEGVKRNRKARRSIESYDCVETAIVAMHKFVHEQEQMTMRQIGLAMFNTTEINDGMGVILEIKPAITLIKGLTLTFTVETE